MQNPLHRSTKNPAMNQFIWHAMICLVLFQIQKTATAADVRAEVSTRETYVGLPTVLRVAINNAVEHDTPIFPEVDGLTIEQAGPPSRNSQTSWINGRKSQRTSVVYSFLVTPQVEGVFTIPPIQVTADGVTTMTQAVKIVATKSETGDLLFAEISGNKNSIYVGESLDLSLKFWIRPYRNQDYQITFREEEMWQCLSERTSWGLFEERVEELAKERKRPGGRQVLRADSEGQQREYLLYEINTTIYPDRATQVDTQDTRVIFNYPVSLGRARSPLDIFSNDDFFSGSPFGSGFGSFGSRLRVAEARPLVAEIKVDPIEVLPIPDQGRPDSYVGAVGVYTIRTEASPLNPQTGDPVTLTITIEGDGSMDVLRAPQLNQQGQITKNFKVTDDSLAGTVEGSKKTFTTTLRPLNAQVTEIPPIEYSYFDPETESFVTVSSEAIPLTVREAEILALNPNAKTSENIPADGAGPLPVEPTPAVTFAPFSGADSLTSRMPFRFWSASSIASIMLPPLLFAGLLLFKRRDRLGDVLPASYRFNKRLETATTNEEVQLALEEFLCRWYKQPKEKNHRSIVIGQIRREGRYKIAEGIERFFHQTDSHPKSVDQTTKAEASAIVSELTHSTRFKGMSGQNHHAAVRMLWPLFLLGASSPLFATETKEPRRLSTNQLPTAQQIDLLSKANKLYTAGLQTKTKSDGQQSFQDAALTLERLVLEGIRNDKLYFNLAETYRKIDLQAHAVAAYRAALAISPMNSRYLDRLVTMEDELQLKQDDTSSKMLAELQNWQFRATSRTGAGIVSFFFWASWWMLWLDAIVLLIWRPAINKILSRSFLGFSVLCFLLSATTLTSYLSQMDATDSVVLSAPSIEVREGNGEQFPLVSIIEGGEGKVLKISQRRGDWLMIETNDNQAGWIRSSQAISIENPIRNSAIALSSAS